MIALDLGDAMSSLGFDVCELAPSANRARSLAMGNQLTLLSLMFVSKEVGQSLSISRASLMP